MSGSHLAAEYIVLALALAMMFLPLEKLHAHLYHK
jgi:hypothetical protein